MIRNYGRTKNTIFVKYVIFRYTLNAILRTGSRQIQNAIFGRVVAIDDIFGRKSGFLKKARDPKLWAHEKCVFHEIMKFSVKTPF